MRICATGGGSPRPGADTGFGLFVQDGAIDHTLPFILLLSFVDGTELLVPFRLQHIGHEAVVGIDPHEPLLRQVGLITGTLHLLAAQSVYFRQATLQLLLDGQGRLQRQGREHLQDQIADGAVHLGARNHLAEPLCVLNAVFLADV